MFKSTCLEHGLMGYSPYSSEAVMVTSSNQFNSGCYIYINIYMHAGRGHFYASTLHLAATAPVNGSPSAHRSVNNVYILTSWAVMYIPAITEHLLSSLCISSPMTFTQPQAFKLRLRDE